MLASRYRLRKNKQFQYVYRRGKSSVAPAVVVIHLPRRDGAIVAGFSVSKKIGNAVRRNRVRRQLRALFAGHIDTLKPGQYIVVAREAARTADFALLSSSLAQALHRGNLHRAKPEGPRPPARP